MLDQLVPGLYLHFGCGLNEQERALADTHRRLKRNVRDLDLRRFRSRGENVGEFDRLKTRFDEDLAAYGSQSRFYSYLSDKIATLTATRKSVMGYKA